MTPIDPGNVFYADVKPPALVAKAVAALKPVPFQIVTEKSTYAPFHEAFEVDAWAIPYFMGGQRLFRKEEAKLVI